MKDYCPKCLVTALVIRDGDYCPDCGTALTEQPEKRKCSCGQEASHRDTFCIACGKPLPPVEGVL
jgi:predicted amidophosphoribosyltransferase